MIATNCKDKTDMARQKPKNEAQPDQNHQGITRITVGGFKAIAEEQSIEIRPLTILAGANSSGKSSIMQPLLLLKQTLEATYDPGALLLNGPNVRFTLAEQLISRKHKASVTKGFTIGIEKANTEVIIQFVQGKDKRLDVEKATYTFGEKSYRLYKGMPQNEIQDILLTEAASRVRNIFTDIILADLDSQIAVVRERCFLTLATSSGTDAVFTFLMRGTLSLEEHIHKIIRLPGLRGNPERTYPVTAVGAELPGTFETYVASIIGQWQSEANHDKLSKVNDDLLQLGLAGKVFVKPIDDTQVEVRVNRFPHSKKNDNEDMVSIADVGLGVSQTLPVIVALHAAEPDQLIYLEQPEIHLHPRAQSAMAEVLADAAIQGKRLVVETHSSLLLLGIQTLVAEGKLPPELVKLHWFTLQEDGSTKITSADLDETGSFGDWPEDFATVTLDSEDRYLDAAQKRLKGK